MRALLAIAALAAGLHATKGAGATLGLFAVGSVGPVLQELAPEFERATGIELAFIAGTSGATLQRIQKDQGDLAIVSTPMLRELETSGRLVPGTATVFEKPLAGVAIRKGTTLDVTTLERLKFAITRAGSIAVEYLPRPVPCALDRHRQIDMNDHVREADGDLSGPHHALSRSSRQDFFYRC